jgi:hypothetical protein
MCIDVSEEHTASVFRVKQTRRVTCKREAERAGRREPWLSRIKQPDDGGSTIFEIVCKLLPDHTASHPRRWSPITVSAVRSANSTQVPV